MKEYAQYDALGLAELVRKREVSPGELLEAAIARVEATEPTLNALHQRLDAAGRSAAGGPLIGPFAGVPFLVKDIAQDIAGLPTGAGNRFLLTKPVAQDSEYVQRLRRAGLVIFGKTATPEFALKGYTEPEGFAPTRNPINPAHSPGGSSGGAAAVVAAGVVPMAGASDGGGSIRIPAAYTGLFGLRPSRGRNPCGPAFGEFWDGASSEHVLSRSVRDSAAMLDVLSGPLAGDPFRIPPPPLPFAELARREPGRLRIGFSTRSPIGQDVHPDVVRVIHETAKTLEGLGHQVEAAEPLIDGLALAKSFITMYFGQTAANVAAAKALGARDEDFELDTRALALLGRGLSAGDYVTERWRWNDYARALGAYFQRYDLYLIPATAFPAPKIGELVTPGWQRASLKPILALGLGKALLKTGAVERMARENLRWTPFTQLSNLTGTPSMSVPMGLSEAGLPIGAQFVAPHGEEGRLLALATQLEPQFQRGRSQV
ncbi:amidase [Stagnimonas aquatica]|uniref:Amidase n=1 Tax=Stagnimonas aquatica TaxID=2689987 RepID=A0A3N0V8C4_9GAMM|nr:amidase [Stagnimonas aquatica]ROH89056.1 amidase [Stagnimonas aquatica]